MRASYGTLCEIKTFGAWLTVWVESGSLPLLSQMANQHCLYESMKEFQESCPVRFSSS